MVLLQQVQGYVARHKRKFLKRGLDNTYAGLAKWCEENDLFKFEEGSDHRVGQILCQLDREDERILVVLTTKHLLKNLALSKQSNTGKCEVNLG